LDNAAFAPSDPARSTSVSHADVQLTFPPPPLPLALLPVLVSRWLVKLLLLVSTTAVAVCRAEGLLRRGDDSTRRRQIV
jgi:hypothetical protein